jgi:hypothetical protein
VRRTKSREIWSLTVAAYRKLYVTKSDFLADYKRLVTVSISLISITSSRIMWVVIQAARPAHHPMRKDPAKKFAYLDE